MYDFRTVELTTNLITFTKLTIQSLSTLAISTERPPTRPPNPERPPTIQVTVQEPKIQILEIGETVQLTCSGYYIVDRVSISQTNTKHIFLSGQFRYMVEPMVSKYYEIYFSW